MTLGTTLPLCAKGHPRDYLRPGGTTLECRTCKRDGSRASKAKARRATGASIRDLDLSGGVKTCTRCKEAKPLDAFAMRTSRKNGLQSWCRNCYSTVRSTEEMQQKERDRWRSPEYRAAARVKWLRGYGLTAEQFEEMMIDQGGCCAICSSEMVLGGGKSIHPHIDHNHETGVVRGLLCIRCNMGLGSFLDDPGLLEIAINYLEKRN